MAHDAELLERAVLVDFYEALTPDLASSLRVEAHQIADCWSLLASALPPSAIVINRTIGLGLRQPAIEQTVRSLAELYNRAGIARYFIHVHPDVASTTLNGWMERHGLKWARGWVKFERGADKPPDFSTDLEVRPACDEDAAVVGNIVADAFDLGAEAAPWVSRLIGRSGWYVYVTTSDGLVAGTGSMMVQGETAWLDWGATAPNYRQRGSQSALMARRIKDALDLGCKRLFTTTGEEIQGDPQHSFRNIVKAGFKPLYTRLNYAPPRPR